MAIGKDIAPMEALLVPELPKGRNWVYEPKWDGFRCIALRRGDRVDLVSKSGKPLGRYFPEIVALLQSLKAKNFVLDGELLIGSGEGYSFSDLQMRLHPAASRVAKLSKEQPATFVLFDFLEGTDKKSTLALAFEARRQQLEEFHEKYGAAEKQLLLSPQTSSVPMAKTWLAKRGWRVDGIIAKDKEAPYQPGERVMQKYKLIRTADCVVGGFRYGSHSREVGSLLLGLYDRKGLLHHVGFTSSIPARDRKALTRQLEKLVRAPGFTGNAPGAPSRWSTERSAEWEPLAPELVVEVAFDHVTNDRFRHGTRLIGFRPDKPPSQCKMDQLGTP